MNGDTEKETFWQALRSAFLRGVVVMVPVVITAWVLKMLFTAIDGTLAFVYTKFLRLEIPGLGFMSMIVLILIVGALSRNLFGRTIGKFFERIIMSIPVAKSIYNPMKDLVKTFQAGGKGKSFRQVFLIEYPRDGIFTVGFVTNEIKIERNGSADDTMSVYILNPPNPTSGVFILVPKQKIQVINMSVEEGLKLVLSGGIVSSGTLSIK